MEKTKLPNVLMVIVDTKNHQGALYAIKRSLDQIKPGFTLFFTDIDVEPRKGFMSVKIDSNEITDGLSYSKFLVNKLPKLLEYACNNLYHDFSHVLIIQYDGFVLDGQSWDPKFLEYDYIGAPWLYIDGRNVGNGGFSLRSLKLMNNIKNFLVLGPEDECIGRLWRGSLEFSGFKFAPEKLAHRFSFELHKPSNFTFGFHGLFHAPYKLRVCINRTGAMGDVIQVEPLLEYFYKKGVEVVLKTQPQYFDLFLDQTYPIERFVEDKTEYDHYIDLDGAYENNPDIDHISAYFKVAGAQDTMKRNASIAHGKLPRILKNKYVVFHIDKRNEVYRNPVFNWDKLAFEFSIQGYDIVLLGNGEPLQEIGVGIKVDTNHTQILKNIVGNADLFVGVDSGISHLAVAMGVKSQIHFGSVLPRIIHFDTSGIDINMGECEHQGCWHEVVGGESGQPCKLKLETPKCCIHD